MSLKTSYFSFGHGHPFFTYPGAFVYVQTEDSSDPRSHMVEVFGTKWACEYRFRAEVEGRCILCIFVDEFGTLHYINDHTLLTLENPKYVDTSLSLFTGDPHANS